MGRATRINKTLILLASLAALGACGRKDVTNLVVTPIATTLTIITGDGQTGTIGLPLPTPLGVRVFDQNGLALVGAPVSWQVLTGGGSVASPTTTTDITGLATNIWTLGPQVGTQTVRAFLPNGQTVTFTATATLVGGPFRLLIVSGNLQTVVAGTPTQPMVVRAVDAAGVAVAGVPVTWTASSGTLSATTTTTDANGLTQVVLTTSTVPSAFTVTATTGTSTVTFTGTAIP